MESITPIPSHRTTLDVSIKLIQLVGIFDYDSPKLYLRIINFFTKMANWIIVILTLGTMAADIVINITDLEAVTNDVGYLFPMLGILIKTFAVTKGQKNIRRLIEEIHKPIKNYVIVQIFSENNVMHYSDVGVLTKIRTTLFYQNFDYAAIATILAGTVIALTAMSADSETKLSLRGIFPYDETVSPVYEIVFFMQFWTVFMSCLWILIIETSVIELIRWINVQLVVLQANYEHCHSFTESRATFQMDNKTYATIINYKYFGVTDEQMVIRSYIPFEETEVNVKDDSFILRYKTCLKHHRRIINSVNKYNDFLSVLQFFTVFNTCSFVCLCLFQIVLNKKNKAAVIKSSVLLAAELSHLFYWCMFGNSLIDEAEVVHQSQYNSGWEKELNSEVRHLLINSLIKSKEPLKVTAGKFFVLSLATYLAVIQNSYSYFAILNTVHSNDE